MFKKIKKNKVLKYKHPSFLPWSLTGRGIFNSLFHVVLSGHQGTCGVSIEPHRHLGNFVLWHLDWGVVKSSQASPFPQPAAPTTTGKGNCGPCTRTHWAPESG